MPLSLRGIAAGLSLAAVAGPASAQETPASEVWIAGDPHLHTTAWGCDRDSDPDRLLELMRLHGLQVGVSLLWGEGMERDRQWFTGADYPGSSAGRILHYDLEVSHFPAEVGGHLILLGLDDLRLPLEADSGIPVAERAIAQDRRVVVGVAHGWKWPADGSFPAPDSWGRPFEFPVLVARGEADFLSTEVADADTVVDPGTFDLWRRLLNTGFRLPLVGASDLPCVHHYLGAGVLRTRVLVRGPVTYEAWLEGIRAGRTVVAVGGDEALDLRVAGARIGETVEAARGEELSVEIEGTLEEAGAVELLLNGRPTQAIQLEPGPTSFATRLALDESGWVAARSPHALTSAVYVRVADRPVRASAADACYFVRYLDYLDTLTESGRLGLGEAAADVRAAFREAQRTFEDRFLEAGGDVCR